MSYIVYAWIASIVFGLEVVIGKFTAKNTISNPWFFNFVWSFFIILLILPFAVANRVGIPVLSFNFFSVGMFYALANILYIIALQHMDVTAMGPLFNFRSVFSVILGVIFLGETISIWQSFLIGIIFIAGVAVSMDEKYSLAAFFRPATIILLLMLLSVTCMGIYTNKAIAESGFWPVTLWSMVFAQVLFLFTVPFFGKELKETKVGKYTGLFLMSLASAAAVLAANKAYAANVGITSTIMAIPFSMIFTISISIINPKLLEHHAPRIYAIRILGAIVMLVAALQLTI